ncbi:MAG: hypothetical protein ABI905_14835, partial [Betaproteobacteria bacterium]
GYGESQGTRFAGVSEAMAVLSCKHVAQRMQTTAIPGRPAIARNSLNGSRNWGIEVSSLYRVKAGSVILGTARHSGDVRLRLVKIRFKACV